MRQIELVIAKIRGLPPAEQDQFAAWILEELHLEERWSNSFEDSRDVLSHLADEALEEHKAKKSQSLNLDIL